jgi:hypothetical protein
VWAAANLGFDYGMHGLFEKSIDYFDKAIRASPIGEPSPRRRDWSRATV